ncbi:MAG: hypothetical protein U0P30_12470 [Vicinamibacterales bacterium]
MPALAARAPGARFLKHPWPERDQQVPVTWAPLADGDVVETAEGPLTVVHTPGRSPDHPGIPARPRARWYYPGDLLVLGSSTVIPGSGGGSLSAYLASLARIADLAPRCASLPAHGPAIDDPLALVAQYIAHRQARETQVLEALVGGATTPAGIAARIYERLDPALVTMAHQSVLAHLVKLQDEGRAAHDGNAWRAVR